MNVRQTKEYFDENNIVALRAYKSEEAPEVEEMMSELGNRLKAIPFYAIFAPGLDEPITFSGLITSGGVIQQIEELRGGDTGTAVAQIEAATH